MKKFVSYLLAALVAVGIPLGTCLTSSAAGTVPDAPQNLKVLTQSVTSSGFTLVWNKPTNYSSITDYSVHVIGGGQDVTYSTNDVTANKSSATNYIKQFYDNKIGDVKDASGNTKVNAYQISKHTFVLTGLSPDTNYSVSVYAVNANGSSLAASLTQATAATATNVIDITNSKYGTVTSSPALVDSTNAVESQIAANTDAIQKAIDQCTTIGGTVLVPAGIYVIRPITLHGDMTLDVEGTLLGSPFADDYTNPYDNDHTQVGQKSTSLISTPATDANGNPASYQNIRIVGKGTINGNGWLNSAADSVPIDSAFPAFIAGKVDTSKSPIVTTVTTAATNHLADNQYEYYLTAQGAANAYSTRSNLITINNTTNVYLGDGVTATNPSQHTIGFTNCKNVVVNGLIAMTYDCNNGDGINFTNSTGLTVVNSVFNTGDDCVNFNAGTGLTGEANQPTGDAWVFDNYFGRGHGVIAMGSGTAAWIQNITAEDNVCNGTAIGLRGKSQSGNGGGARNIVFRDSALANIYDNDGSAFLFTDSYSDKAAVVTNNWADDEPTFHDILIQNCTVNGTKKAAIVISGASDGYDYNITFDNIAFGGVYASGKKYDYAPTISYARNIKFNNVTFNSSYYTIVGAKALSAANIWDDVTNSCDLSFTGSTTVPTFFPGSWSVGSTLTASNVTDTTATVTWNGTSSGATGYEILDSNGNVLATAGATDTSANLTGLTAGTKYTFTVASVNTSNNLSSNAYDDATSGPSVLVTTTGTAASSSTSASSTTSTSASNPKTGDTTIPVQLPIMLSVVMLATLVGVRRMRRHA